MATAGVVEVSAMETAALATALESALSEKRRMVKDSRPSVLRSLLRV